MEIITSIREKEKQAEKLKGWILGLVNGIDARMLVDMIKKNEIPTLWEYELPRYLGFVKELMVEYKDDILEQLTFDVVMKYAKEYREDLAKILVHKRAEAWMNRFLNKCKFMFKNIELEPYEIQAKYEERMTELRNKRDAVQAEQIAIIMAREQQEFEQAEKIKAEELEILRQKQAKEKELKDEAKRERKIKRQEEMRSVFSKDMMPSIELIPAEVVEAQLTEQEADEQIERVKTPLSDDLIDKKIFDAIGKKPSDNKYDFL